MLICRHVVGGVQGWWTWPKKRFRLNAVGGGVSTLGNGCCFWFYLVLFVWGKIKIWFLTWGKRKEGIFGNRPIRCVNRPSHLRGYVRGLSFSSARKRLLCKQHTASGKKGVADSFYRLGLFLPFFSPFNIRWYVFVKKAMTEIQTSEYVACLSVQAFEFCSSLRMAS
jgi:hypothetical protein